MSNLNVANIVNPTTADTTPTNNLSKQVCKAWVNFNGTVVTIRDSYNVASITDNGTGDYTVNFTSPMPNPNYSVNVCVKEFVGSLGSSVYGAFGNGTGEGDTFATNFVRVGAKAGSTYYDANYVFVQVFSS